MHFLDLAVHAGQQVKILGENYTLEDEEDSRIGNVSGDVFPCLGKIARFCDGFVLAIMAADSFLTSVLEIIHSANKKQHWIF